MDLKNEISKDGVGAFTICYEAEMIACNIL
jgi:hypothetical protein